MKKIKYLKTTYKKEKSAKIMFSFLIDGSTCFRCVNKKGKVFSISAEDVVKFK
jgi:hypothetical protein